MFLSRIQLNPARRGTRRLVSSPQTLHAAVLAGFADPAPSSDGRVLWRLDRHGEHRLLLYVASPDRPDFTHISEQAGWPTTETWETASYERLLDSLRAGDVWQFRLTANPVRSGRRDGWEDTKPLAHVTVSQQQQWLLDRAERAGLRILPVASASHDAQAVPDLAVVERRVHRFDRQGARVTIATATYQGMLEVTDIDALRHHLTHGIGRAKAYGCGLMTLAKPSAAKTT